jgi:hypothetical protein
LSVDQYKALLRAIPEINASLKTGGVDVGESALPDDDEEDPKPQRKSKTKKEKANIEATSDEDEG